MDSHRTHLIPPWFQDAFFCCLTLLVGQFPLLNFILSLRVWPFECPRFMQISNHLQSWSIKSHAFRLGRPVTASLPSTTLTSTQMYTTLLFSLLFSFLGFGFLGFGFVLFDLFCFIFVCFVWTLGDFFSFLWAHLYNLKYFYLFYPEFSCVL